MPRLTYRDWAVLAALTVLAAALRAYRLDAGLWYDEVLTLLDYVRLPAGEIVSTYESLNNHILFTLQSHLSVAIFGESAWALRLPAAILGVAAVPLLWFVVRGIGAPVGYAHVSALLLALNYHHIWFSQNARGYTGLVFWCLLALYFTTRALRGGGGRAWAGVALAGALAMYTHLSAAFFLSALFLAAMLAETLGGAVDSRRRILGILAGFGAMAAIVLAAYLPIIGDILATMSDVAAPEAVDAGDGGENPLAKWENPLRALTSALDELPGPLGAALIALPLTLIVLFAGWLRVLRGDPVTAWVVPLSIAVTVALLLAAGMRIWPRYFLTDVVLFLVLATTGVAAVANAIAPERLARGLTWAGWGLGIAVSAVWGAQNYVVPKQDFTGGIAFAEAGAGPEDQFATFGLSALPISRYFRPGWSVLDNGADLDAALSEQGALWIVIGFEDHSRANYPQIFTRLDTHFDRLEKLRGTLGDGTILVYRSRPGTNGAD